MSEFRPEIRAAECDPPQQSGEQTKAADAVGFASCFTHLSGDISLARQYKIGRELLKN